MRAQPSDALVAGGEFGQLPLDAGDPLLDLRDQLRSVGALAAQSRAERQLARFSTTAASTACLTAFCNEPPAAWKRQTSPVRRSGLSFAEGKTRLPAPLGCRVRVLAVEGVGLAGRICGTYKTASASHGWIR